jgi:hypothetical protein
MLRSAYSISDVFFTLNVGTPERVGEESRLKAVMSATFDDSSSSAKTSAR